MQTRQPVLFLSHGSPMTALGGDELSSVWAKLAERLPKPDAILMISAHWNTRAPVLTSSAHPETIHDFGGFPAELYRLRYPAPGAPDSAQRIAQLLSTSGFAVGLDETRGLDHGAWVPLRILFPETNVPVIQLSVQPQLDARHHYAMGQALAALSDENVLIVGSGHMTHNLRDFLYPPTGERPASATRAFYEWAHGCILNQRDDDLLDWEKAPGARYAHPTPEHFLPLFVALGAAGSNRQTDWLGGGWIEDALAADNYCFTRPQKSDL